MKDILARQYLHFQKVIAQLFITLFQANFCVILLRKLFIDNFPILACHYYSLSLIIIIILVTALQRKTTSNTHDPPTVNGVSRNLCLQFLLK